MYIRKGNRSGAVVNADMSSTAYVVLTPLTVSTQTVPLSDVVKELSVPVMVPPVPAIRYW